MIIQLQKKYQLSILKLLGVVAVLGVFPFVIKRSLEGNYTVAIIDAVLALGIIAMVIYAHRSQKTRAASLAAAIFINIGVVLIASANGIDSFLWVYPVFASTFFLVKPIEALCINVVAAIALVVLSDVFNIISLDSYIITIVMLSMSGFVHASHNVKQFQLLETLNTVDPLTGALNRRALNADIEAALANSERNDTQQLLAILDLDYFKTVNDSFGHAVGDQVLQSFVNIATHNIRKYDKIYRYGGEEFVILIADISPEQQHAFIHNLNTAIKETLKTPEGQPITVSVGVAAWLSGTTMDSWLKRADDALYRAKANGRNCAVFSEAITVAELQKS